MKSRQETTAEYGRLIWGVMLIALIVRLVYLYLYSDLPDWDQLTVDNWYHHHWAQSIASGNIFGDTTYFRAPLYVYILGGLYALLGSSFWIGRLLGLVIGLATIYTTFRLGSRLFTPKIGLWGAVIYAFMSTSLYFEAELLLDPLFTLLCMIGLYLFLGWIKYRTTGTLLTTGLVFGLATITRPTLLAFIPILLIYILLASDSKKRGRSFFLFLIGLAVTIGPIFARNLIVADDPVLVSSQGGINFYIGNNPTADGVTAALPEPLGHNWRIKDTKYLAEQASGDTLSPGQQSSYWYKKGREWIEADPIAFASLFLKKLYLYFSPEEFSNNRSIPDFFRQIWLLRYNRLDFGLVLPFALLGLAWSLKGNQQVKLIIWFILIISLVAALFFVSSRFRLPIIPLLAILAATGSLELINRYRQGIKALLPTVPVVAVVSLILNLSLVSLPVSAANQDYLSKGLKYINRSEFVEALYYLKGAQKTDDHFPTTNLNIGICYFRLGKADSARFYFDREKLFHPLRPKAYINQASLYLVNDQFDSALTEINHALELRPFDRTAWMLELRTLTSAGYAPDSIYKAALTAARTTDDDVYLLIEALKQFQLRRDFETAAKFIAAVEGPKRPAVETDDTAFDAVWPYSPTNYQRVSAEWYFHLGFVYGSLGQLELSVRNSEQALKLNPTHKRAAQNLITGYESIGQTAKADSIRALWKDQLN